MAARLDGVSTAAITAVAATVAATHSAGRNPPMDAAGVVQLPLLGNTVARIAMPNTLPSALAQTNDTERLTRDVTPGGVAPLAGARVLALLGGQRCEDAAELLHHAAVQQGRVADPGHPEHGEFREGGGLRDAEHVDRARALRNEGRQRAGLRQPDREHAVGTGAEVCPRPAQSLRHELTLGTPARTRDGRRKEDIDPRIDHKPVTLTGCGLAHITQPCRLLGGIAQRLGRVVGVLEVASRRPMPFSSATSSTAVIPYPASASTVTGTPTFRVIRAAAASISPAGAPSWSW